MSKQDFAEYQANVEATARGFRNLPSGKTVIFCADGDQILLYANGQSRLLPRNERVNL